MKQGTKSFLFGAHQFIVHPLFIIIAWCKYYHHFPKFWQLVCIFIHDIGLIGNDYLIGDNKRGHWKRGAILAQTLFYMLYSYNHLDESLDLKAFYLVAGHTDESGYSRSKLFIPDKICYLYIPMWWLHWCTFLEGFNGKYSLVPAEKWVEMVRDNMEKGFPIDSHDMYMNERDK